MRQASARGEAERRAIGPGAFDVEMARNEPFITRILQPRDLEPGAEPIQVHAIDVAFAGKAQRLPGSIEASPGPGANRGAEKTRFGKGRAADDERLAESSGDVVVECQRALDARHGNGLWHEAQIEAGGRPCKLKRKRFVETNRS